MNINHLHTLDRIVLDQESYHKMFLWYNSLKEIPETLDIPFYEGILMMPIQNIDETQLDEFAKNKEYHDKVSEIDKKELLESVLQKEIHMYFNLGDNRDITCTQLEYDRQTKTYDPILTFTCKQESFEKTKKFDIKSHLKRAKVSKTEYQNLAKQAFSLVMQTLHFISNYQEEMDIQEHRVVKIKKGKAKGGKPSKNRVVRVGVKTYRFYSSTDASASHYQRHTDSWRVRGHWRYYPKTGKRVWIEPYTKGDGKVEAKEYKV